MTPLVIIRHGPTQWNSNRRLQGRTDIPLSGEGRALVSRWQVPFKLHEYQWVSSPLKRARETAELLAGTPPRIEPLLTEMNYGEWEGRRLDDLRAELGDAMAENEARGLDFRPEGGETPREVQARLKQWLEIVGERRIAVVAVSHHGVLRALYSMATGWDMAGPPLEKFRWGAMHRFAVSEGGDVRVECINIDLAKAVAETR